MQQNNKFLLLKGLSSLVLALSLLAAVTGLTGAPPYVTFTGLFLKKSILPALSSASFTPEISIRNCSR